MNGTTTSSSLWSRPRLFVSWLLWFVVYLLVFLAGPSFWPFVFLRAALGIRPAPLQKATDNQRLGSAITVLIVSPLTAVLLGSESALAFCAPRLGVCYLSPFGWALLSRTSVSTGTCRHYLLRHMQPTSPNESSSAIRSGCGSRRGICRREAHCPAPPPSVRAPREIVASRGPAR